MAGTDKQLSGRKQMADIQLNTLVLTKITQIKKGNTEQTNEGMEVTLNAQICLKTQIKKTEVEKTTTSSQMKNKISLLSSVLGTGRINHSNL